MFGEQAPDHFTPILTVTLPLPLTRFQIAREFDIGGEEPSTGLATHVTCPLKHTAILTGVP